MSTLEQCKQKAVEFLKDELSNVSRGIDALPTRKGWKATKAKGQTHFEVTEVPDWWKIGKCIPMKQSTRASMDALSQCMLANRKIRSVLGKTIYTPSAGKSVTPDGLASDLIFAYLMESGRPRWNPTLFEKIWSACLDYLDDEKRELSCTLYAPIWSPTRVPKRLVLDNGLEIRELTPTRVAHLATIDRTLAGVETSPGFRQWTVHHLVIPWSVPKLICSGTSPPLEWNPLSGIIAPYSFLNEELMILRSFVNERIAMPSFAVIRHGFPPHAGPTQIVVLPWKAKMFVVQKGPSQFRCYRALRRSFLELHGSKEWGRVAGTMRRFAIAFDNISVADTLRDVVAALEGLLVGDKKPKVSYRLRERAARLLESPRLSPNGIKENIKVAYDYRSRIAHGDFVFDNMYEFDFAMRTKNVRAKKGNLAHDHNEIQRLIKVATTYYRTILVKLIRDRKLAVDWSSIGL